MNVAEQFTSTLQQREAARLGMWAFLTSELLIFAALLTGYTVYRIEHAEAFSAASAELYVWIGAVNTAILLLSSTTMAIAVRDAQLRPERPRARWLLATATLAAAFLALKLVEYRIDWHEALVPGVRFDPEPFADPHAAQLFFAFYWVLTLIHALHVVGGIGLILSAAIVARTGWGVSSRENFIDNVGLYWHFVDVVWIFLFPLLYLV